MKLSNFTIADDHIAFEQSDKYYDVHNCFDFIGFDYDVSKRTIILNWIKNSGDWVPSDSPNRLSLHLEGVYLFKAKERDPDVPFTEDDCLSSIGFLWNELIEEMGGYHSHEPKENCTHLSMEFMSGLAIKIGADSASLSTVSA